MIYQIGAIITAIVGSGMIGFLACNDAKADVIDASADLQYARHGNVTCYRFSRLQGISCVITGKVEK